MGEKLSSLKTQENDGDVRAFLQHVDNARRRDDSLVLLALMERASGLPPRMWGDSIVGFGAYEYVQKNGTPGRWPLTGFSPRKAALTVYIMPGFKKYGALLDRLGMFKASVSCLYITRLANVDLAVLTELVAKSVDDMRAMYDA